jgi:transposase
MKRLSMRKISEAMRLAASGLSGREMSLSLGVGRTTVREYLSRARVVGLVWPLDDSLNDEALEALLFPPSQGLIEGSFTLPDWPTIHKELRRKDVTLSLLWEEYRSIHNNGYAYSRFCDLYRRWKGNLSPVMRQLSIIESNYRSRQGPLFSIIW